MKKKMVFGFIFVVFFALQGQAVFAQSDQLNFRVHQANLFPSGKVEDITNRVQGAALGVASGSLMFVLMFKDGSEITFDFTESNRTADGWSLKGGRRLSDSGNYLPGYYNGEFKLPPSDEWSRSHGADKYCFVQIKDDRGNWVLFFSGTPMSF